MNHHEHACFGLSSPWPPRYARPYFIACLGPARFLCSDPFRHEKLRPLLRRLAPFHLVLGCSRPLVGVDAESSEAVEETPHLFFFLPPPRSWRPPTSSPNITHFGSLVSSMRATNPANRIRLLRKIASML